MAIGVEKSKERGFFTMDAFFAMMVIVLMASSLSSLYQGRKDMVDSTRAKLEGRMVSEKLAGAIDTVYATGEPLTINLDIPDNINGKNYRPAFHQEARRIFMENLGLSFTRAHVVLENLKISENLVPTEEIEIYWENDQIVVRNP